MPSFKRLKLYLNDKSHSFKTNKIKAIIPNAWTQ